MTGDLARRAARCRRAMVKALADWGTITSPHVLEVMGRVPRETFVPRFWAPPFLPGEPEGNGLREWRVEDDISALDLVYDIDLALAVHPPSAVRGRRGGKVTSTASAPRVVGWMLELLDLSPGQRVLEIGLGSGYNAALIRELVGPEGSVTSVDIDAELVTETAGRLAGAGYGDINLVAADGYFGSPEGAPYDRVVATVGCVDLAPAWLDQLSPTGFCLVPLQHGTWHPLTRAQHDDGEVVGTAVGRTSFVAIQGRQAARSPWPASDRGARELPLKWSPLPRGLTSAMRSRPGEEGSDLELAWDLAYLLALEDHRASFLRLVEHGSVARLEPALAAIGWAGPGGPALRDRLLAVAQRWSELGCPAMAEYESKFTRLGTPGPPPEDAVWVVDRFDFRQTLRLRGRTLT